MFALVRTALGIAVGGVLAIAAFANGPNVLRPRDGLAPPAASAVAPPQPAAQAQAGPGGRRIVLYPDRRGHYAATVDVNGRSVSMMVDTGASIVALTAEDAAQIGLRPYPNDYRAAIATANGTVYAAPARISEIRHGPIVVRDVAAVVMPKGALGQSLLGMSFLQKLAGFEVSNGALTMRQ